MNTKYILIFDNIKMTQYNSLNVKVSNSQLSKFKSAIKNENKAVLRLSSNMVGDNETNFPHKLLLTNRQVSNIRKAFANHCSADIKWSKTQLSKMIQSGRFLGRLRGPLLKTGLPAALAAVPLAADAVIHKKVLGSGNTTLITSNEEIHDIIRIIKSLEDSGLLLKVVTETFQNEVKEQKGGFLRALLGTLGVILLGDLLIGKGIYRAGKGKGINSAGKGVLRAGYGNSNSKMDF